MEANLEGSTADSRVAWTSWKSADTLRNAEKEETQHFQNPSPAVNHVTLAFFYLQKLHLMKDKMKDLGRTMRGEDMWSFSMRKQETTINQTKRKLPSCTADRCLRTWKQKCWHETKKKKPSKDTEINTSSCTLTLACDSGLCEGGAEQARIPLNQVWLLTPSWGACVRGSHRTFKASLIRETDVELIRAWS